MKRVHLLLLALTLLCSTDIFSQGRVDGFFKEKYQLDVALGYNFESNEQFYAGKTAIDFPRDISSRSFFTAYGITNRLNINASFAHVEIGTESDLQDGAIFLKYLVHEKALTKGKIAFSVAAGYSTNLSDYQTEGSNAIGKQATSYDLRPVIHYTHESGYFSTFQLAGISNSDPTPNAINMALKLGKAHSKYYFDVWYEYFESDGGLDYRGTAQVLTFRELGTDFHRVGATIYKPLLEWLGAYAAANQILSGRNIGDGYSIGVGLVIKPAR